MGEATSTEVVTDEGSLRQYVRLALAVLAMFVLQASVGETKVGRGLEVLAGSIALLLALDLGQVSRRWRHIAIGVIVLALIGVPIDLLAEPAGTLTALTLLNGVLVAFAPPAIFMAIRRHPVVSVRTLIGAVTIYLLVGMFFAFIYRAILLNDADAFQTTVGSLDPAALQYFSVVTLTTVGFGDITAVSGVARTLVALEALIGQIYLVTVVAVVVGHLGVARRRE
jgi:hypothetical protein